MVSCRQIHQTLESFHRKRHYNAASILSVSVVAIQMTLLVTYLSLDIIFNVLVHLPAEILFDVMRYVCRDWYNVVSSRTFIDAHLKNAERGLLIYQHPYCKRFVDGTMTSDCDDDDFLPIQTVEFGRSDNEPHHVVGTSCNGLVVTYDYETNIIYVENSITKEIVTLPPPCCSSLIYIRSHPRVRMGYTRLSKTYKLVLFYYNDKYELECKILTLGVDKEWRSLFQVRTGDTIENFGFCDFGFNNLRVSADGILHVIHPCLLLVLNLDLESETIYTCAAPKRSKENRTTYIGNGRSLCFLDKLGMFSWNLWLLKDPKTGDWTKIAKIDLGTHMKMLRRTLCPPEYVLLPVGFLKDGEIVVFNVVHEKEYQSGYHHDNHPSRNCITYNIKTVGRLKLFHFDRSYTSETDDWRYIPHVKSLVSPNSLYG